MAAAKKSTLGIAFRRFRKLPNGKVLDARTYGHKAWPMRGSDKKPPNRRT